MIKYLDFLNKENVELFFKQKSDEEILFIDPIVEEWKG
jgi:hypothetical protein